MTKYEHITENVTEYENNKNGFQYELIRCFYLDLVASENIY